MELFNLVLKLIGNQSWRFLNFTFNAGFIYFLLIFTIELRKVNNIERFFS